MGWFMTDSRNRHYIMGRFMTDSRNRHYIMGRLMTDSLNRHYIMGLISTMPVTVKLTSEKRSMNMRLHWTGFYTARYIVGIFVTGFPNEARYSLINVCNEL
jgi:hypothetical protein